MTRPYSLQEKNDKRSRPGPRVTLLTGIAVLFVGFMLVNTGLTIVNSQEELEGRALESGDRIEYHVTVTRDDGSLVETTVLETAQRAGRTQAFQVGDPESYEPLQATLDPEDPGLGYGPEVEQAVVASYAGATVRTSAEQDSEWEPFPSPDFLPRILGPQPFARTVFLQEPAAAAEEGNTGTQNFDLDRLEQEIGTIEPGMTFNPRPDSPFWPSWDIVFEDVNRDNRSVTYRETAEHGEFFQVDGIPGGITVLIENDETELHFRLDFEEGTFVLEDGHPLLGEGFEAGSYNVEEVTDEQVRIFHHASADPELIGQPVNVEIRILRKL